MFPLQEFDFAGATTRDRVLAHNNAVAALEAEQLAVERQAAELASLDPMTADPDETEATGSKLRRQRHANAKQQITLLQERLLIVAALQHDRQQAHQQAAEALGRAQAEVLAGLRVLGFGPWLDCPDQVVRMQAAELVRHATGPAAAICRLEAVRDDGTSLAELHGGTQREIRQLTEQLRAVLQGATTETRRRGEQFAAV